MSEKEEKTRDSLIESMGSLGESLGLNRTVCQMYALLYFSPEPLSPAEISRSLGISKGNVSINMKKLEEWNALKKVWKKGYARSLYSANDDIEEIVLDRIKAGIEKRMKSLKQALGKNSIKPSGKISGNPVLEALSQKISKLESFIDKINYLAKNLDYLKSFTK